MAGGKDTRRRSVQPISLAVSVRKNSGAPCSRHIAMSWMKATRLIEAGMISKMLVAGLARGRTTPVALRPLQHLGHCASEALDGR